MEADNQGFCYEERIGSAAAGRSVLGYLTERYRHSNEASWIDRIAAGRVHVDGAEIGATHRLAPGEVLSWHRPPWREPEAPTSFAVLRQDDDVLAVAKPRGLAAMPGAGFLERTLLRQVAAYEPNATPLHRLGRGTSGITLFALNPRARKHLTDAWQLSRVTRRYRALVQGVPRWKEITLDAPIGPVPHAVLETVAAASPDGKRAVSHFRVIEPRSETALIEVEIETGRAHQIRIHLAVSGHPLHGDPLYPKGGVPKPTTRILPGTPGYHLHAHFVRYPGLDGHPVEVSCRSPELLRVGRS